jgi:hypothetical protein
MPHGPPKSLSFGILSRECHLQCIEEVCIKQEKGLMDHSA